MKNIMHKTTLREIRGSLGRWMAILAIVALGVGFFCGLKMCKNDFMKTGDEYVLSHNFYNYKLLTTLGLEEEDVKIIEAAEGVKAAEGSWSSDVLVSDGSSEIQLENSSLLNAGLLAWAAEYSADGRMTDVVIGALKEVNGVWSIDLPCEIRSNWTIYLLDPVTYAPVCEVLTGF